MVDAADVNQKAALDAVRSQSRRCLELLESIVAANARIKAKIDQKDPLWTRVADQRYNQVCRDASDYRKTPTGQDDFLDFISADPDLRTVCTSRWLLGQAVDGLRSRLNRLSSISQPYELLEEQIREAVTGTDRSPAELDGAAAEAVRLARLAEKWRPEPVGTRMDQFTEWCKNNQITAPLLILAGAVAAALPIFTGLGSLLGSIPKWWPPPATEGWAIGGTFDPSTPNRWPQINVTVVKPSPVGHVSTPIAVGDIVEPRMPLPEWIVDYADHKNEEVDSPPGFSDYQTPAPNRTGALYRQGARFNVTAVSLMRLPTQGSILWIQLHPVG